MAPNPPNFESDELRAGVDEAGRGCLAGPVVAAAVVLPRIWNLRGLDDSKKVSPANRARLETEIKNCAVAWSVGVIWPEEIDRINILRASLKAMAIAAANLKKPPSLLLIDGDRLIDGETLRREWEKRREEPLPARRAIVDGDAIEPVISAASILAKTFRDRLMIALDRIWPGYDFASNKGYGVKKHLDALEKFGPCPLHRLSFRRVKPSRSAARLPLTFCADAEK